ncbi:MAG: PBSX family phage terminase large subunit [Aquabacterium sp.]
MVAAVRAAVHQMLNEPAKLSALFDGPARYRVAHGGRGGAKSWGFARRLLLRAIQASTRVLCTREFQTSIEDSVYRLLVDQIDAMGLGPYFDVKKREIVCRFNDSRFMFEGLARNVRNIKSKEGIDIAWVEEAEKVSDSSWELLIPTIRKPGSEIWISFNPADEGDPTYKRFVLGSPPDMRRVEINYWDNPWFPDELRKEMEYLRSIDTDAYLHVWCGQPRQRSDAQVLNGKWRIDSWTDKDMAGADGPYYGMDWGFSVDPSAGVRCWLKDGSLFIDYEVGGQGIELDDLPDVIRRLPGADSRVIRADNSRPETISHVSRPRAGKPGLRVIAAEKWSGSVEDGIAWLRGLKGIVIHERCKSVVQEARLWSYKVDKLTGDVLPELVDAHNHWWDAVRYALQPLIRKRDPMKAVPNFHMAR